MATADGDTLVVEGQAPVGRQRLVRAARVATVIGVTLLESNPGTNADAPSGVTAIAFGELEPPIVTGPATTAPSPGSMADTVPSKPVTSRRAVVASAPAG